MRMNLNPSAYPGGRTSQVVIEVGPRRDQRFGGTVLDCRINHLLLPLGGPPEVFEGSKVISVLHLTRASSRCTSASYGVSSTATSKCGVASAAMFLMNRILARLKWAVVCRRSISNACFNLSTAPSRSPSWARDVPRLTRARALLGTASTVAPNSSAASWYRPLANARRPRTKWTSPPSWTFHSQKHRVFCRRLTWHPLPLALSNAKSRTLPMMCASSRIDALLKGGR